MSDDDDDRPDEPKKTKTKGPKKRFQERDDTGDDDDDRPRKKRRTDDEDADDRPDDDDKPKKKRRVVTDEDRGPRVQTNDGPPVMMLLALIGSAIGLLAVCIGCGWWSWVAIVGGGDFGGSANEFEVTSVSRQAGLRPSDAPSVYWAVAAKRTTSTKDGQYYLVMKCGNQTATKKIDPNGGKGWSASGGGQELTLKGSSGPLEVWVEKRPNPVASGTVVSNVFKVQ